MNDRVEIVSRVYQSFGNGDAAALAALLADVDWYEAEGMPYGGRYRGFEEVAVNVFGPIGKDVEGFTAKPDAIVPAGDDQVLATGRYRGSASAGAVDVAFAHLWTVTNGQIARFVQYADTHLYRQALGHQG